MDRAGNENAGDQFHFANVEVYHGVKRGARNGIDTTVLFTLLFLRGDD